MPKTSRLGSALTLVTFAALGAFATACSANTDTDSETPEANAASPDTGSPGADTSDDPSSPGADPSSPSSPSSPSTPTVDPTVCSVTAATTVTAVTNTNGCAVLDRNTDACNAARVAAGFSGAWLKLSCRVVLTIANGVVTAKSDGRPDYKSFYFPDADACYEAFPAGKHNPNQIATGSLSIQLAKTPGGAGKTMQGSAIVGVSVNGVPIFGNFAAPGDDIFNEAQTFDRCGGHPQNTGMYHYHGEPYALTQDDARLVGIMRDGYAVYGRKDADGTYPASLDAEGGHTGLTADSPATAVYHYHVNQQTSTGQRTAGQKQWFITNGKFHAAPASCPGC